MSNISYLIYHAERPLSAAEQREADVRAGELAAAVTRLGRSLRRVVTGSRDAGRANACPGGAAPSRALPRPR